MALDTDFLLCSAYKFYGPHVGILYARPGLLDRLRTDRLSVQDEAAPFRIETGTLNHAALAGVKAAVEYIASWGEGADLRAADRLGDDRDRRAGSTAWPLPITSRSGRFRASPSGGPDFSVPRAPTVSITIDGVHPTDAARALGEKGIQVWDGNFYAARAIEVLGLAGRGGVIRTGFAMYNTAEEVERLLAGVRELGLGQPA